MKRFITILTIVICCATVAAAQPAQPAHRNSGGGDNSDTRSKFHDFQMKQIEEALNLEGERLTKFQELYRQYTEESRPTPNTNENMPRRRTGNTANNSEPDNQQQRPAMRQNSQPTEEQIEESIKQSFESSRKSIEIKERYYNLFRAFMKPSEINMMYEIERRSRERFVDELQKRTHR